MKVGMFTQAFCKEIVSPLSDYFMGMDVMSGWATLLTDIVKPKPVSKGHRQECKV